MRATHPPPLDPLAALRKLTLAQVEGRLAEIDAERAALSTLRRSLVARDRANRRTPPAVRKEGGCAGA